MKVDFYGLKEVPLSRMEYVVVMARHKGRWIFVQHRDRTTWEIPGGRIEAEESFVDAAARELMEESGAVKFALFPIEIYSVTRTPGEVSYGVLFFADVHELGPMPEGYEMARQELALELPEQLTYPEVQPILYYRTMDFILERKF